MDFNRSFLAYDTLEGANCQTVFPEKMSSAGSGDGGGEAHRSAPDRRSGYGMVWNKDGGSGNVPGATGIAETLPEMSHSPRKHFIPFFRLSVRVTVEKTVFSGSFTQIRGFSWRNRNISVLPDDSPSKCPTSSRSVAARWFGKNLHQEAPPAAGFPVCHQRQSCSHKAYWKW